MKKNTKMKCDLTLKLFSGGTDGCDDVRDVSQHRGKEQQPEQ